MPASLGFPVLTLVVLYRLVGRLVNKVMLSRRMQALGKACERRTGCSHSREHNADPTFAYGGSTGATGHAELGVAPLAKAMSITCEARLDFCLPSDSERYLIYQTAH